MKHTAKVYDGKHLVAQEDFDLLGEAVSFCNDNASTGYRCKVVETLMSLTGRIDCGTIVAWDYNKELA